MKMWLSTARYAALAAALTLVMPVAAGQAPDLENMDIVLRSIHNGPIATVNGVDIPKRDFVEQYNARLARERQMRGGEVPDVDRVRLGIYCLGQVVQREILWQEAQKRNLKVDNKQVEKVLEETLNQLGGARPDKKLSQSEVLNLAGTDRETAMEEVRKGLLIENARKAIAKERGVKVTSSEIMSYYSENEGLFQRPESLHLKQIYFRVPKAVGDAATVKREEARKKAEACLARLNQGITFEGLAKRESEGPAEMRENGGDMGPVPVNELPPSFATAAKQLKPGEVSGVVETQFGFHIIKLVEALDAEPVDMDRAKEAIEAQLMMQKAEGAVRGFVQQVMTDGTYDVTDYLNIERQLETRPDLVEQLTAEAPSGS